MLKAKHKPEKESWFFLGWNLCSGGFQETSGDLRLLMKNYNNSSGSIDFSI